MADEKLPIISVRGAGDDHKVALWEQHPDHPDGEAFVVNEDKGVDVAETAAVKQGLAQGTLVKYEEAARSETPKVNGEPETPNLRQVPRRNP